MEEHPLVTTRITAIMRGRIQKLRSGEMIRLAPERTLAEELHVSRQSLRTSIKKLVDDGLLVQKHGSGTYIVPHLGISEIHLIKASDIKHDDPFYMAFLSEIAHHISLENMPLLTINEDRLPKRMSNAPLIIVGYLSESTYKKVRQEYRNIVAVQGHPMYKDVTQIDINYYKIGYDAGIELAKHNHRTVLHVGGPDEYPAAVARRMGFQDAMREANADFHIIKGKMNWKYGFSIGKKIAEEYIEAKKVTAIFAANDWLAIGLMNRLQGLGIRIPNDVSIIGCDDIPLASEMMPGLTTFRENFHLLISTVYEQLNEMHTSSDYVSKKILLPAEYIVRASL